MSSFTKPLPVIIWLPCSIWMAAFALCTASFVLYFLIFFVFRHFGNAPEPFVRSYYLFMSCGMFAAMDIASVSQKSPALNTRCPNPSRKSLGAIGTSVAMGLIAPGCLAFVLLSLWSWVVLGALPPQLTSVFHPNVSTLGLVWEICDTVFLLAVSLISVLFVPQFLAIARWFQAQGTQPMPSWRRGFSRAAGVLFLGQSVGVLLTLATQKGLSWSCTSLLVLAVGSSAMLGILLTFGRRLLREVTWLYAFLVFLVGFPCSVLMQQPLCSSWMLLIGAALLLSVLLLAPEAMFRYRTLQGAIKALYETEKADAKA